MKGKKAFGKVCLELCQTQNVKKKKCLKELMNPSQALPASPSGVDALLLVGFFRAPPS